MGGDIVFKKVCSLILILVLALSLSGCGAEKSAEKEENGGEQIKPPIENTEREILNDTGFTKGFNLLGLNSSVDGTTVYKKIRYGNTLGTPQWQLAQWWSKYNLKDGTESSTDKRYTLKDASKAVSVDMSNYDLTLEVNAEHEFERFNESAPSAWPHLLIEQNLKEPVSIASAEKINAKLGFTIDKSDDKRGADGRGFHAQFSWFIYIVDKNPDSPGYGNFLWFGLNIFDSNNEYAGPYASQDTAGGAGNFIYSLGAKTFLDSPITPGKPTEIEIDILPYVKEALEKAAERGFMIGTELNDCSITGTNIGWEVFDRWNVSVTIRDIGIKITDTKI